MTPASINSSSTPLPPDPLPFLDEATARERATAAAQPFWGRLFRAAILLALAALAHVWLGRTPDDRPALATTVAQQGSLAQALTTGAPVEAAGAGFNREAENAGVTVRTELVPVSTIGFDQPAVGVLPIPSAAPQPTGTAGILAVDHRGPVAAEPTPTSTRDAIAVDAPPAEPTQRNDDAPAPEPAPQTTPLSASSHPLRELPRAIAAPALSVRARTPERVIHAAPIVEPDPREQVTRVLQQYATAYERLDVDAAKEVYPSLNDSALRRAFSQIETQRVTFASCDFTISGSGRDANARCQGENEYLPRVGPRTLRRDPREWTFDLAKAGDGWHIVRATVR